MVAYRCMLATIATICLSTAYAEEPVRKWTDASGKSQLTASLISVEDQPRARWKSHVDGQHWQVSHRSNVHQTRW